MEYKFFSKTQKEPLFVVKTDREREPHIVVKINDRSTAEVATVDERWKDTIKTCLKEMVDLDAVQVKDILRVLSCDSEIYQYGKELLNKKADFYQKLIDEELKKMRNIGDGTGKEICQKRKDGYARIKDLEEEKKKYLFQ